MASKYATQGSQLAYCLKQRHHTYMQMLKHGVSTSPWKRIEEWLALNVEWMLDKRKTRDGLVAWRVVKKPSVGAWF